MCLFVTNIKTAEEDLTFYKAVIIQDGNIVSPYQEFKIEVGKEYTITDGISPSLCKYHKKNGYPLREGVFHLYVNKPQNTPLLLKAIVKKGEQYFEGTFNDELSVGVTKVQYEYINDEDKLLFQKLLTLSKKKLTIRRRNDLIIAVTKQIDPHRPYLVFNVVNTEGELMYEQWFDYIDCFLNGFAKVGLNGKSNFIDTKGKLLSEQWFDYAGNFSYDTEHARVWLKDKGWNYINTKGELVSEFLKIMT